MFFTRAVIVAILGLASATPINPGPLGTSATQDVNYVATFDDLSKPISAIAPILQPIGPYDGLYYSSLVLANRPEGGLGAVNPQSSPNVAGFGIFDTTATGTPSIKADYDNSVTKSFIFKSFYFACVINTANSLVAPPAACDLLITGLSAGKPIATQIYNFQPTGMASTDMRKVTLESTFVNVDEVTFQLTGTLATITGGVLDDLQYTLSTY